MGYACLPLPLKGGWVVVSKQNDRVGVIALNEGPPPGSLRSPTSPFQGEV
jgi:hypothetical protein